MGNAGIQPGQSAQLVESRWGCRGVLAVVGRLVLVLSGSGGSVHEPHDDRGNNHVILHHLAGLDMAERFAPSYRDNTGASSPNFFTFIYLF